MQRWHSLLDSKGVERIIFLILSISILFPFYIGGITLLIGAILLLIYHRRTLFQDLGRLGWLMVFLLYATGVTLYFKNYIGLAVLGALLLLSLVFLYYHRTIQPQSFVQHLRLLVGGSIPLAFLSFFEYGHYVLTHGYDLFYIFKYHNPQTRAEATFFNPNYYGLFIAMVIPMAIYLLGRSKRLSDRWIASLAIGLNLICLILTASRWSIPTVIVASVLMLFFLKPAIAWFIGVIFSASLGILLIFPDILPRFTTLAHAFDDRFAIWQVGWQLFLTSPLIGRGPMAYVSFYYLFVDEGKMHSHQLLIDSLANYGVVGVMLLTMSTALFIRQLIDQLKQPLIRPEIGLMVTILLTVLFHGLMDVGIFWLQTGYIFLLVLAFPLSRMEDLAVYWKKERQN